MHQLKYVFQDPYMPEEQEVKLYSKAEALDAFNAIPWYQNVRDSFLYHNGDAALNKKMVENDFWFLSYEYLDKNKNEVVLLIVPNYTTNDDYVEDDLRFSLVYKRPKKVKTNALYRLFGGANEKLKTDFFSHVKGVDKVQTEAIINQFFEANTTWLDRNLPEPGEDLYD